MKQEYNYRTFWRGESWQLEWCTITTNIHKEFFIKQHFGLFYGLDELHRLFREVPSARIPLRLLAFIFLLEGIVVDFLVVVVIAFAKTMLFKVLLAINCPSELVEELVQNLPEIGFGFSFFCRNCPSKLLEFRFDLGRRKDGKVGLFYELSSMNDGNGID